MIYMIFWFTDDIYDIYIYDIYHMMLMIYMRSRIYDIYGIYDLFVIYDIYVVYGHLGHDPRHMFDLNKDHAWLWT